MNNRNLQILFLPMLAALLLLDLKFGYSFYPYLIFVMLYLAFNIYGSSVIRANYFMQSVCKGSSGAKTIAISFDDGPTVPQTEEVLNVLKLQKVPAAFFVIGKNVPGNEALLKRMDSEGHIIGNHSYSHNYWFSMKSGDNMLIDLKKCDEEIKRVLHRQPLLFRPPYGVTNPMVAEAVKKGAYTSVGWSLRTFDTSAKNKEQLLQKSLNKLHNGDVVLFHEWSEHTVSILEDFIKAARLKGYVFVGIEELLGVKAYI